MPVKLLIHSRTISLQAIVSVLLLTALPAWGDDSEKRAHDETRVKPPAAAASVVTIDDEIAKAEAAIRAEPASASAHVRLAYLQLEKGALDEALKSFHEALILNPHAYEAKTGTGIVFARKGNFKEAEQVLRNALILNPNPVRTHYEIGLIYEKLGEFEKAAAEFKEGIRKHEQGRL